MEKNFEHLLSNDWLIGLHVLFVWQQNALLHIVCRIDFFIIFYFYGLYILQTYAPTTLATARDFWTLRYTTGLEDGSLVVCYVIALLFAALFWVLLEKIYVLNF